MKHPFRWVVAAAATVAAVGLSIGGAQSGPPSVADLAKQRDQALDQLENGPAAKVLNNNAVFVIGIWRNGQGHLVRLPARFVQVNTVNGPMTRQEVTVPDPAAAIERQLPPVDPARDKIPATPEQVAELGARADAEQAKHEPWRAGGPRPEANGPVQQPTTEDTRVVEVSSSEEYGSHNH
jgi:hypothetical protein